MTQPAETPVTIACPGGFSASINPLGAELWTLNDGTGRDLLWDGDPAFWTGRAPVLFPVIGCLRHGTYCWRGRKYAMPKHGFARHSAFETAACSAESVTLRLVESDATLAVYPFPFVLDLTFTVAARSLEVTARVTNAGAEPLPLSFGFHPALRWPLEPGTDQAGHVLAFAEPEPDNIWRLDADGLLARREASPVNDRTLPLSSDLFVDDALIFAGLRSRRVALLGPEGHGLAVDFPAFPDLGVWQKPGAGYLCIEPWQGMADPADARGEIFEKPGVIALAPGAAWSAAMTISLA